jgi:hypothetical protein
LSSTNIRKTGLYPHRASKGDMPIVLFLAGFVAYEALGSRVLQETDSDARITAQLCA